MDLKNQLDWMSRTMSVTGAYLLSKSKILIQLAVAAQSQYRLGEKTRALTTSPASREYRCLPSFKSQSMVIPSLPPEAAREPSGETEIVLI